MWWRRRLDRYDDYRSVKLNNWLNEHRKRGYVNNAHWLHPYNVHIDKFHHDKWYKHDFYHLANHQFANNEFPHDQHNFKRFVHRFSHFARHQQYGGRSVQLQLQRTQ